MKKRKAPNMLNFEKRLQIIDWLRAHNDDLPNMSSIEITKAVSDTIHQPCSIVQIRQTAKAARIRWKIRKTMPSGRSGIAGRMDKMEIRLKELEQWCVATADGLGVQPPSIDTPLPDDEEIQS